MIASSPASVVQALGSEALGAAAADPQVRGADWRQAIVQTVNADGTVTTTDGIKARRRDTYLAPAVGDRIIVAISGNGNWLAHGRLASGDGAWVTLSLAAGWSANASYYTPAYRLNGDGTASLCGLASMSGTLAGGAIVTTLPAEARPAKQVRCAVQVAIGYFGVITIATNGDVSLNDYNPTLPTTGTKYAQFDVLSRYRLA